MRDGIERIVEEEGRLLTRYSTRDATVPAGTVHEAAAARARERRLGLGGAGNAGRGASPTAGKREGISF